MAKVLDICALCKKKRFLNFTRLCKRCSTRKRAAAIASDALEKQQESDAIEQEAKERKEAKLAEQEAKEAGEETSEESAEEKSEEKPSEDDAEKSDDKKKEEK